MKKASFFIILTFSLFISTFTQSLLIHAQEPSASDQALQIQQSNPSSEYLNLLVRMLCIFFPCIDQPNEPVGAGIPVPTISGVPQPTTILPTSQPPTDEQLDIADSALRLFEIIQGNNCQGTATVANDCYNRIKDIDIIKNTSAGVELHASIYKTGLRQLQCVGFAKAASAAAGRSWGVIHGAARNYLPPAKSPNGFQFVSKGTSGIRPGDIPIWDHAPAGHTAVVVEVYDENNFRVAEANWENRGEVQLRPKQVNGPTDRFARNLRGWYRKI